MNAFTFIIIFFILLGQFLESVAEFLNIKNLAPEVPKEFTDVYDAKKYQRSQEYTKAKSRFSLASSWINLLFILAFILLQGFPWLDNLIQGLGWGYLLDGLMFFALLGLGLDFLNLPLELYSVFVLEERFGFNRMTWKTFFADKVKGYLLAMVIGGPVLAGLMLFLKQFPVWGWLYAWVFIVLAMLFLQYIAPTWILPLFNKFTPLEDGELKKKIQDFCKQVGFNLTGVFVIDGSKRSSKANAYFTGLGKRKRIALFDNLLKKHSPDELLVVLAHEVGHFKLRHILKNMFISIVKTGLLLFLMSLFLNYTPLFRAFGMQSEPVYAGLVFFMLLYTPVTMLMSLIFNNLSRKYEFQADSFASRSTGRPEELIKALKRLSADNLSNLTPHPFYVFINYSHPPVLERIKALKGLKGKGLA